MVKLDSLFTFFPQGVGSMPFFPASEFNQTINNNWKIKRKGKSSK